MMSNPTKGQPVRLHYRKGARRWFPWHGKTGTVAIVGHGKPSNHGIDIDGTIVIVPAGNLRPA